MAMAPPASVHHCYAYSVHAKHWRLKLHQTEDAIGRAVAIGLGTTFAVVQLLAYGGFVTVQWSKIHEDILRMCDVNGDGQFGATDMHSAIGSVLAMLSQGLPSVSGFCLGFGLGLRF
ncbi:hypothetical protein WJX77_004944 [Trebouxia sp. C0004]